MRPAVHRLLLALMLAAIGTTGCGEDRIVGPPNNNPQSKYPILLNPYSVLDALRLAYQERDTNEIAILFDDNYQGTSIDQTDPSPTLLTFFKSDEIRHVRALALSASITSVWVLNASNMVRMRDAGDPPGWATIQNPIQTIEINDSPIPYRVDAAQEAIDFKFIPHTPDRRSPTDTTWKIIRWSEVRN